MTGLVSLKFEH